MIQGVFIFQDLEFKFSSTFLRIFGVHYKQKVKLYSWDDIKVQFGLVYI